MNCASQQLDETPPFKIISATYSNWAGGVKGVSGTNINITYKASQQIAFDSIFYKKRKTKVSFKNHNDVTSLLGQFQNKRINKLHDMILDADPKKEFGNKPNPNAKKNFPFDLKNNEAIVSYKHKGVTKYYKITNLTQQQEQYRIQ